MRLARRREFLKVGSMRVFLILLSCLALSLASAHAQSITVEVVLEEKAYLAEEDLVARVRITNFSGRTVAFGTTPDWLILDVEGPDRVPLSTRQPLPIEGEFVVESSKVATRRVNIAPSFNMRRPGRYRMSATVRVAETGQALQSKAVSFDIIRGNAIWESSFGIPALDGDDAPEEMRKYTLVQTSHQKQLKIYLRLSSANDQEIFRVFPIGNVISFSRPEAQIDQFSNLHVLYQIGARNFLYVMINPDGVMLDRQIYEQTTSRPMLRAGENGLIRVAGGLRQMTALDFPTPASPPPLSDAAPIQP
jgi:hypothetical protein